MSNIVTVEISMYPLVEDYEAHIIPFINSVNGVNGVNGLLVKTNAMSTFIQGPFELVWSSLGQAFQEAFDSGVPMSNVLKIIPRKLPIDDVWLEF